MFRSIDVFEARKEGYKTYRVPGITVTKNDVVLVTAEARPNEGSVIGILMMWFYVVV